ncbi:membrane protein [Pseudomonas taeanensis MS-3]|uniref:Membrane protein n=1 Tax=Pseudomonas taeanensis MS-3 TaxID=1395571 RepID=A0A0A1YLQ9_9PSED|nr:RDD family protein [Pseudomonas taeanensis]KFX69609.1 membrane protein [Pseudomonas taeanensis MS-3]
MPSSITTPPAVPHPVLDTRYQVETPEGIDLLLRPAGLVPRALAFAIDLTIRGLLLLVLFIVLGLLGQFGMGLATVLLFLVTWWYMVLFEVFNQGRTPGKQLLGLRVIHDDGTPVGWAASLTRNLLRFVDILPFGYTLGILSCLNHPAFKRLGDLAAGTLVVYRDLPIARPVLPQAESLRAPFALSFSEQRAFQGFAERADSLSSARRAELAAILAEPLQVPAEQAEQQINGIARGLLGST